MSTCEACIHVGLQALNALQLLHHKM